MQKWHLCNPFTRATVDLGFFFYCSFPQIEEEVPAVLVAFVHALNAKAGKDVLLRCSCTLPAQLVEYFAASWNQMLSMRA